jgi:transcriptional regulator with XRE-family HTH domain
MVQSEIAPAKPSAVGSLIQYWRKMRHLSQLALANEADVSPRHVCFVETGRAKPSREMVLLLAQVLDVPLRERNALLLAAGFAPVYRETNLDAPELGQVRVALDAILRQQEPYPAVVMNRVWDVIGTNDAAQRFFSFLLGPAAASGPANVIRLMFDPQKLRPYVDDWESIAEALVQRVHREAVGGVRDEATARLLDEILGYPDVPRRFRKPNVETAVLPILPVRFSKDGKSFNYFSTVTTLGTPLDVTLQEVRIECFFPADPNTERLARELRDGSARAVG